MSIIEQLLPESKTAKTWRLMHEAENAQSVKHLNMIRGRFEAHLRRCRMSEELQASAMRHFERTSPRFVTKDWRADK